MIERRQQQAEKSRIGSAGPRIPASNLGPRHKVWFWIVGIGCVLVMVGAVYAMIWPSPNKVAENPAVLATPAPAPHVPPPPPRTTTGEPLQSLPAETTGQEPTRR